MSDGSEKLEKIRTEVVLAIAFLGRDVGTDREKDIIPQIVTGLVRADKQLREIIASAPSEKPVARELAECIGRYMSERDYRSRLSLKAAEFVANRGPASPHPGEANSSDGGMEADVKSVDLRPPA